MFLSNLRAIIGILTLYLDLNQCFHNNSLKLKHQTSKGNDLENAKNNLSYLSYNYNFHIRYHSRNIKPTLILLVQSLTSRFSMALLTDIEMDTAHTALFFVYIEQR